MRPVSARFSPTWWAAWTCALHRPGRLDDEEIPEGVDGATPVWAHYPAGAAVEGREEAAADRDGDPAEDYEPDVSDVGFDPYVGSYTDDC